MRTSSGLLPLVLIGTAVAVCALLPVRRMLPDERGPVAAGHSRVADCVEHRHAPSATCSRPAPHSAAIELARFVVPAGLHVVAADADLDSVFARWEAASSELEPVGPHERRRLTALFHPGRSAHELDLICELRGPIRAGALAERYEWRAPVVGARHIELTAETRDGVERLFFRRFTLKLDRATCLPVSIQFTDGTGTAKSLPFALETNLGLEARLSRAMREPDGFGPVIIPAGYTPDEANPADEGLAPKLLEVPAPRP